MPVIGFIHPLTLEEVGWDYFDTDTSHHGRPAVAPWHARMIADKEMSDLRHTGTDLTATGVLACPREMAISRTHEYHVNPVKRFTMDRGTGMHKIAGAYWNPKHFMTEEQPEHRENMTLVGSLFGCDVSALCDVFRVEPGTKRVIEIIDMKFPSDFSARWRKNQNGYSKKEHAVQLNIARLLLDQSEWAREAGYDLNAVEMTIWDHAGEPEPLRVPVMDEGEMMEVMPFGGTASVGERIGLWRDAATQIEAGVDPVEVCAELPLTGAPDMNGKKCTQYCSVADICGRLARGVR